MSFSTWANAELISVRSVILRRDQAKDGQKPAQEKPMGMWKPTKEGFVQFLVDSKAVHDALEDIVEKGDEQCEWLQ